MQSSTNYNYQKNYLEQKQFLLDSNLLFGNYGKRMIDGKAVCDKTFCKVLSFSLKRLRQSQTHYKQGFTKVPRKVYSRSEQNKSTEAKTWINGYLSGTECLTYKKIHLLHFLTKKNVNEQMTRELADQEILEKDIVTWKTFDKFWKKDFSDAIIPEV